MSTQMTTEPVIVEREEQPYVALRQTVTMQTISDIADRFPELFAALAEREIQIVGAPFLKYNLFESSGRMEMEAGVPVPAGVSLPAGVSSPAGPREPEGLM